MASPSSSLWTFQYSICGLSCGKVVSSTSSLSAEERNFSSTDEGSISVLAHELMHIADGDNDSLRPLVAAVGNKASDLTGLEIHGQRGEEITCDLIGAMAVRSYITDTPGYESIARRAARSIQHNPVLVRELINDRQERK